mgnify:CR=1 FL=1
MLEVKQLCVAYGESRVVDVYRVGSDQALRLRGPLPPVGASLSEFERLLPEMEFWFPSDALPTAEVDRLCQVHLLDGHARPQLPARELQGMLMGFADLVFFHGGRYWVLDYKSNALGTRDADYTHAALAGSMAEHRYDVQAGLYLLALTLASDMSRDLAPHSGLNETDPAVLKQAAEMLKKQKALVKAYDSADFATKLSSGDVWLAHGYTGQLAFNKFDFDGFLGDRMTAVQAAGMSTLEKEQRLSYELENDQRGKSSAVNLQNA